MLFERLFMELLPQLQQRWQQRLRRLLVTSVQFAKEHFERVVMEKVGFKYERDLVHADLPHVLYRITAFTKK